VPGATFFRSYDNVTYTDKSYPATLSDFRLDVYEVTVGRFRQFVNAYVIPADSTGKNPNDISDNGWQFPWRQDMSQDAMELKMALNCDTAPTWTDMMDANESRPINCVNWYEALAFCIWDGGRLPTEAEWNYAAAGGTDQRAFPWSDPSTSTTFDSTYAESDIFDSSHLALPVGSKSTKSDGKWNHADLASNMAEFVRDSFVSPYASGQCTDCATFSPDTTRVVRGGAYNNVTTALLSSARASTSPTTRSNQFGFRCARKP
jgi:formylglycine-generating enzyme required for sulfatase activity